MINKFCKQPLWECNRDLIKVAQGQKPADIVIKNAKLVNVCTAEILQDTQVAISCGRVAYVGIAPHTADHTIGEDTEVIDAKGKYLAPGFMDAHMHIESAMIGPSEYARATVPCGTTAIFADPHEIANVSGLDGVKAMIDDAKRTPLKTMITTPSCVPAVPGFEDTGSAIFAKDVAETMEWDEVAALGEMMNFPGILNCQDNAIEEVNETLKSGKCVTGHYSIPEQDRGLNAYIASGISCDHETILPEDVLAKLRLGMYVQLREGSAWHNLKILAPAIVDHKIDTRFCCLVSDDNHPHTLTSEGHLDRILRLAVKCGINPIEAIQMVTINTATCFGLNSDMGSVAPGKCADLVLLEDLEDFRVTLTMIDGQIVAEDGKAKFDPEPFVWPDNVVNTMNVGTEITPSVFKVKVDGDKDEVKVRVMGMMAGHTDNKNLICTMKVKDGFIEADSEQDILKVAVFERHHKTGSYSLGFVNGFKIHGALAQTVAHDAHNLLVMGDNDEDMALAARTLIECGGGEVAVLNGEILGLVELPIAGLMSDKHVDEVSRDVAHIEKAWKEMGCAMPSPFMTMGGMSLACIPELRLTNKGYVNCLTFEFEPLIVED